jgi:DNA-binding transcriptional regulator YhcF (GntR family)
MKARYKAIVDRFAASIRRGDIASGTRLPTHRDLAAKEHISLATATRVYAELEAMGLVSGETGRGRSSERLRCRLVTASISTRWPAMSLI